VNGFLAGNTQGCPFELWLFFGLFLYVVLFISFILCLFCSDKSGTICRIGRSTLGGCARDRLAVRTSRRELCRYAPTRLAPLILLRHL
jgi:hypothetical protein